jgi:hypothetical protein
LLHPSLQFLPASKQRERDHVLRLTHIETLLLLCTTRWGRETLRANGVYEIVRVMHESEKDEKVSSDIKLARTTCLAIVLKVIENIERLVNLLKRDEAPIEEVDEASQPAGEDIIRTGNPVEDDDDDVIQEV